MKAWPLVLAIAHMLALLLWAVWSGGAEASGNSEERDQETER